MDILFQIIIILASILLTFLVFVQNPKGGGLSSDFGSAQQLGGVQKTNDFIVKGTWTLASVIMLFSILLTLRNKPEVIEVEQSTQTEQPGQPGQPAAPEGGQ
ncbi:MAG: preprotein translocase subunit SecG [Crocinitomicaceae bacterium]|jgi:preprotein translocase subunit SecG|nr:preprotein translocase subunit SecG [Crocinitomicaceae bacterium]MDG2464524.1 preprotein translocase subunit SecG [Crocinitomicaceae bacterium]